MKTSIDEKRDNVICIGFVNDSAVFVDECGEVFYKPDSKDFFEIGEPTVLDDLISIDALDAIDKEYIFENLL